MKSYTETIYYETGGREVELIVHVDYEQSEPISPSDNDPAGDPGEYKSYIDFIELVTGIDENVDITNLLNTKSKQEILDIADNQKWDS